MPYYNKPTQEGLYRHFKAIAEAVDMPMIVYNVPGRTVCDMQNDTVVRLAQIPNIVGIKDATANLERGADLIRRAPKGFAIYSGDDGTALPLMLMGGDGVISVTANVAPRLMHDMCAAAFAADLAKARALNNKLLGLHRHLFVEANPIPVKWVLQEMGMIQSGDSPSAYAAVIVVPRPAARCDGAGRDRGADAGDLKIWRALHAR